MYKFSMDDCDFYVNEEKRTVSCVLNNTEDMLIDYIDENLYLSAWDINCAQNGFIKKVRMPKRFVGIAKCADGDEWDEELGRKIAYTRLREKVYASFFRHARTYINTIDDWIEKSLFKFNNFGERIDCEMEHRHAYIADQLSIREKENEEKM